MISWPSVLFPKPTVEFGSNRITSVTVNTFETGYTRQRRRFLKGYDECSIRWELNDQDYLTFQSYVNNKLSGGADNFTIDLPYGDGYRTYTAKFKEGRYSSQNYGVLNWRISATLIIDDVDDLLLTSEEIDLLILLDNNVDLFETINNDYYNLIHVLFPEVYQNSPI